MAEPETGDEGADPLETLEILRGEMLRLGQFSRYEWAGRLYEVMRSIRAGRRRVEEVAAELEKWCEGKTTHHEWCGCQIARRLREPYKAESTGP